MKKQRDYRHLLFRFKLVILLLHKLLLLDFTERDKQTVSTTVYTTVLLYASGGPCYKSEIGEFPISCESGRVAKFSYCGIGNDEHYKQSRIPNNISVLLLYIYRPIYETSKLCQIFHDFPPVPSSLVHLSNFFSIFQAYV